MSLTCPAFAQDYSGQKLNWLVTQPRIGAATKLKEMFEAMTGATIELTAIPYDASESQATLDVSSGANQYDMIDYWYASIGAMAENGIMVDITDKIEAEKDYIQPEDFLEPFSDIYMEYGGRRYGLPWDGDAHVLFYNQELLDANGFGVPTTWDEYYDATKGITEAGKADGKYGAVIMGVNIPVALGSGFVNRVAGYQGRLLTKDNQSALLEDIQLICAQQLEKVVPYCFPTPAEVGFENGIPAFLGGNAAMIEFWTDLGIHAENDPNSAIAGKWGVTSLPVGVAGQKPRAALNAGWGLGISTGSQNQDLAWEFIKWATSPAVQLEVSSTPGTFSDPVRESVMTSKEYTVFAPKVAEAQIAASKDFMPWPKIPESPQLMRILTDELAKMMAGQQNYQETMEVTDRQWKRLLG
ncbi:sugar ABC transporter substrate-binding protein [uncultured Tateyamaria sp.]|uniref:ABC transporter substrate-binding protein n=1 Tax=uncultured Tateyamaria sp. TaxID=455651 RepID=UPI002601F177|nr:sugar ABC transporter substrate-binding protein [uncultured Tateyamaria sp.]